MFRISPTLLLSILMLLSINSFAQSENSKTPHPKFGPFEGLVYDLPELEITKGKLKSIGIQEYYSDTIYSYPKIGTITLQKLDIPESNTKEDKFPGIDKTIKFAMILESEMEILIDGCYEFTLKSDDGSRLWIDEVQLINNDGGHKMRTKKDSTSFYKGTYTAKVWYFQGMPDRFGIKLDAKLIGKVEACPNNFEKNEKIITLQKFYFDTDAFKINNEAQKEIEEAAIIIKKSNPRQIEIIGHTDNQGSDEYNKNLSMKRAEAVKQSLMVLLDNKKIRYIIKGLGSTQPIASNENNEGKSKNRRVELKFY